MDKNVIDHIFLGKGRMNRRQYWNVCILVYLVPGLLTLLMSFIIGLYFPELLNGKGTLEQVGSPVFLPIFIIYLILPLLLIGAHLRRAHDIGISSGVAWIATILIISSGYYPPEFYGSFIVTVLSLIIGIILAFYPGKKDKNTRGEQPQDLKKVSEIIRFWRTGKS